MAPAAEMLLRPGVTLQRLTCFSAMCGITGQFNFIRRDPVDPDTIRRMTATIVHRGPDDEGYFVSDGVALGVRRLSIIDLAGGHQPMSDSEETVWVGFNGEIYNFKELRAELEQCGRQFRTKSDTEVIIHGYNVYTFTGQCIQVSGES